LSAGRAVHPTDQLSGDQNVARKCHLVCVASRNLEFAQEKRPVVMNWLRRREALRKVAPLRGGSA
jgi:hypothetical protein